LLQAALATEAVLGEVEACPEGGTELRFAEGCEEMDEGFESAVVGGARGASLGPAGWGSFWEAQLAQAVEGWVALVHGAGLAPTAIQDQEVGVRVARQAVRRCDLGLRTGVEDEAGAFWGDERIPVQGLVLRPVPEELAVSKQQMGESTGVGLAEELGVMDETPDIQAWVHGTELPTDAVPAEETAIGAGSAAFAVIGRQEGEREVVLRG
jgi:hypothetical protein